MRKTILILAAMALEFGINLGVASAQPDGNWHLR